MNARKMVYLVAGVIAVAGVLLLAGPAGASRQVHAAAATNLHCGDTIDASITMNGYLDCSGYAGTALTVTSNNVTLDLGGHTIIGNSGYDVVVASNTCPDAGNCDGVTVTDGTITGGRAQIKFWGAGDTASNLTLTGAARYGLVIGSSTDAVVTNNTISGAGTYDLWGQYDSSSNINSNVFLDAGSDNVYLEYSNGDSVSSNVSRVSGTSGSSSAENYYDYESDMNNWSGNVATSGSYGFDIEPDGNGLVNLTNNAARSAYYDGIYVYDDYGPEIYAGGPWAMISGNQSNYNGEGFYEECSYASFVNNSASRNTGDGFDFYEPCADTITGNTAKYNQSSGFYLGDTEAYYHPKAFANNSAWFNGDYGFSAEYTTAGSGNVGGGTNSPSDCLDVSGCS